MKRSKNVYLVILPAIALAACDETTPIQPAHDEVKHCVDSDGGVVEDSLCEVDGGEEHHSNPPRPITAYPQNYPQFRWYYGGTNGDTMAPGTRISGGSFDPTPGRSYASPSTISRGGFGGIGRGVGVGAGE